MAIRSGKRPNPYGIQRASEVVLAVLMFLPLAPSQAARPQSGAVNDQKAAPSLVHDISGVWEPTPPGSGIQPQGPRNMPNDGKPEHELRYTPYGLQVYKSHKPLEGPIAVAPGLGNDPKDLCEPVGFPRMNWNLRITQIVQTDSKVLILYQSDQKWREIIMNQEVPNEVNAEPQFLAILLANGRTITRWSSRRLG